MNASITNVAAHLAAQADRQPDALAIAYPDRIGRYRRVTFSELNAECDAMAHGLVHYGIRRSMRTVLMVPPSLDFFAVSFALLKIGAVPVMVDPGMGVRRLGRCLDEAKPAAFIGSPKAHAARILFRWPAGVPACVVTAGRRWGWGGTTLARLTERGRGAGAFAIEATASEDVAAILFTSGSTGPPKGAVYTHGIFLAQIDMLRRSYGIEAGEIDLPTFPLFALFDPALGMSAIIPEMDPTRPMRVDPEKLVRAIERFRVTNMFGSPAVLHRFGTHARAGSERLASLRRVICAGAPVQPAVLERFGQLLDDRVRVHTSYGATEALPVSSIDAAEILHETAAATAAGKGVCVGRPLPELEVAVIRIDDGPVEAWSDTMTLPINEIGEITVKGSIVSPAYWGRPKATALAKIAEADGSIRHRMGDLGYFDDRGRLWFCGRKAHRVQTAAATLFSVACEGVFNVHPDVYRSALVGVERNGVVTPVLCVELHRPGSTDRERIACELREMGAEQPCTVSVDTILFHRRFPVDVRHNAKIFREQLAQWATRRLA